jgi:hypothetical protein
MLSVVCCFWNVLFGWGHGSFKQLRRGSRSFLSGSSAPPCCEAIGRRRLLVKACIKSVAEACRRVSGRESSLSSIEVTATGFRNIISRARVDGDRPLAGQSLMHQARPSRPCHLAECREGRLSRYIMGIIVRGCVSATCNENHCSRR